MTVENNYIRKYHSAKDAKVFLQDTAVGNITSIDKDSIGTLSDFIYGYLDQYLTVTDMTLVKLFTPQVSTVPRIKELISIAMWIHASLPTTFAIGQTREHAIDIFEKQIEPYSAAEDAKVIKFFLDALTLYGYYFSEDFNNSYVRLMVYNIVTSVMISHPYFLNEYLKLICYPAHQKDIDSFKQIILDSYSSRENLLYVSNSAFFANVESGLKLILDSRHKEKVEV